MSKMGVIFVFVNSSVMVMFNESADLRDQLASDDEMAYWATGIQQHYLKVVCAIGFPGNLAAILTVVTVRPYSTATFLVALLAASDSAALLVKLILNQFYFYFRLTDDYCRGEVVSNVCSSFANWVLVLIGVERLVAVALPVVRHRFLSKRRVYVLCLVLAALLLAVHAPLMAGRFQTGRYCEAHGELRYYAEDVWPWLNTVLYALLPQVLLLLITTALLLTLRRAGHRRKWLMGGQHHPQNPPNPKASKGGRSVGGSKVNRELRRSERGLTSMTIAAASLFIVMVLPQCVYSLSLHTGILGALHLTPKEMLVKQVVYVLADSTHALNFYLYFISVRRFRAQFWHMLQCRGQGVGLAAFPCACCCCCCCSSASSRPLAVWNSTSSRSSKRETTINSVLDHQVGS